MLVILLILLLSAARTHAHAYTAAELSAVGVEHNLVPVLVIGSGPAGLAAAFYTARAKLPTFVVHGHEPGGQLMGSSWVENMPGVEPAKGYKIIEDMQRQAVNQGAQFLDGSVELIERSTSGNYFMVHIDSGLKINALTVIVATGATARILNIPGESVYMNNGVFTCAVCDCAQAQDKEVIVVGGGDSAIEHIMHLAPYAKRITLMVRKDHLRAAPVMQDRLKAYNSVRVLYNTAPVAIEGDGTTLQGVRVRNTQTGQESFMSADCVFLAIGHIPHSGIFANLLPMDAEGYIHLPTRAQKTIVPGIFVAGDVADRIYRQAAVAMGDGSKAGLDAIAYLHEYGFNEQLSAELAPYYLNF